MKKPNDVFSLPVCKRHLNLGDKCDTCEKGVMRPASARKNKFELNKASGKYEMHDSTQYLECNSCGHLHQKERTSQKPLDIGDAEVTAVVERSRNADTKIKKA